MCCLVKASNHSSNFHFLFGKKNWEHCWIMQIVRHEGWDRRSSFRSRLRKIKRGNEALISHRTLGTPIFYVFWNIFECSSFPYEPLFHFSICDQVKVISYSMLVESGPIYGTVHRDHPLVSFSCRVCHFGRACWKVLAQRIRHVWKTALCFVIFPKTSCSLPNFSHFVLAWVPAASIIGFSNGPFALNSSAMQFIQVLTLISAGFANPCNPPLPFHSFFSAIAFPSASFSNYSTFPPRAVLFGTRSCREKSGGGHTMWHPSCLTTWYEARGIGA